MKTPIKCACAICGVDLSARQAEVNTLGHTTRALRAPPRARITYEVSGGADQGVRRLFVELWLCERDGNVGLALGVLAHRVADTEETPPAAACPRCGGWTSYGGMSQHAKSTVPVRGRVGCTC